MSSKIFSSKGLSTDFGLLILRIFSGGILFTHGWAKLQNVIAGNMQFADPIGLGTQTSLYLAIFAEALCGILIVLGIVTRLALIAPIITMLVAFFIVHSPDPFNIKELSFLYLGMFITLFFTGPGKLSLDKALFKG